MKKTAVYALTGQGAELAGRIADLLDGDLYLPRTLASSPRAIPFDRLMDAVAHHFASYTGHVFLAAAGIVVRAIAPHLGSKERDPAVVVLDQGGRFVISLLSGHLGGANDLARRIAAFTGGEAVITTATDTAGIISVDLLAAGRNLGIQNMAALKKVNMALLNGRSVQVFDPEDRLGFKGNGHKLPASYQMVGEEGWKSDRPGIWVDWRVKDPEANQLVLVPGCLVAGVGCNRGTGRHEISDLIRRVFHIHGLNIRSLKCLATIEDKRDEKGLSAAAVDLGVPVFYFSRSELASVPIPSPSETVKRHMGVSSVCESAALLKSRGGRLLVPKVKSLNATLAVALED